MGEIRRRVNGLPRRNQLKLAQDKLDSLPAPESGSKIYFDVGARHSVPGLGLRVTSSGARAWILNYTSPDGGRRRYTIGRHPEITLAAARADAQDLRTGIRKGIDPFKVKE